MYTLRPAEFVAVGMQIDRHSLQLPWVPYHYNNPAAITSYEIGRYKFVLLGHIRQEVYYRML